MPQDRGLLDDATPHCERCHRPLSRVGDDRWNCVNSECERRGEIVTIAD